MGKEAGESKETKGGERARVGEIGGAEETK